MIPGGFGERGFEGKIAAAGYARENGVPCLGICLGLQAMTIEFARNVMGLAGANSTEMDPTTPHPVIDLMHDQRDVADKGGTQRLGAYYADPRARHQGAPRPTASRSSASATATARSSTPAEAEARRRPACAAAGCRPIAAWSSSSSSTDHPFWVGTQAHPEFKSRPDRPHPLFRELVGAALARRRSASPHILFDSSTKPARRRVTRLAAGFRHLGDRLVHQGYIWHVAVGDVRGARRRASFERDIVRSPGAVGVVPLLFDAEGDPSVVLVRQYRAPLRPVRARGPGRDARRRRAKPTEVTARRELIEEAGLSAGRLEYADAVLSVGRDDRLGAAHLPGDRADAGRARAARSGGGRTWRCSTFRWPRRVDMVARGEIHDAKTVIGLLLVDRRLRRAADASVAVTTSSCRSRSRSSCRGWPPNAAGRRTRWPPTAATPATARGCRRTGDTVDDVDRADARRVRRRTSREQVRAPASASPASWRRSGCCTGSSSTEGDAARRPDRRHRGRRACRPASRSR